MVRYNLGMSTIGIELPEQLRAYLDEQVARRGYRDASAFLTDLLQAERHRQFDKEIDEMLNEALDSPSEPWTEKDLQDIESLGKKILQRRRGK